MPRVEGRIIIHLSSTFPLTVFFFLLGQTISATDEQIINNYRELMSGYPTKSGSPSFRPQILSDLDTNLTEMHGCPFHDSVLVNLIYKVSKISTYVSKEINYLI